MLGLEPCAHLEGHKAGSDLARRSEFDSSGEWVSQHQRAIGSHPSSLAPGWCRQVGTASDDLRSVLEVYQSVQPCVGSGGHCIPIMIAITCADLRSSSRFCRTCCSMLISSRILWVSTSCRSFRSCRLSRRPKAMLTSSACRAR